MVEDLGVSAMRAETQVTEALKLLAPCFARAISESSELRDLIVGTALEMRTGDTELLFEWIAEETILLDTRSISVSDYLRASAVEYGMSEPSFDGLIETVPSFNLLLVDPVDGAGVDFLVTANDYSVPEFELQTVVAYDMSGNAVVLDAQAVAPPVRTIVLGISERAGGNDFGYERLGVSPKGLENKTINWERVKIDNINLVEGWLNGAAEVYLSMFYKSGGSTLPLVQRHVSYARASSGSWVNVGSYLFYWNTAVYGTGVGGAIVEYDGNNGAGSAIEWSLPGLYMTISSFDYDDPDPKIDTYDEDGGAWAYLTTYTDGQQFCGDFGMRVQLGF